MDFTVLIVLKTALTITPHEVVYTCTSWCVQCWFEFIQLSLHFTPNRSPSEHVILTLVHVFQVGSYSVCLPSMSNTVSAAFRHAWQIKKAIFILFPSVKNILWIILYYLLIYLSTHLCMPSLMKSRWWCQWHRYEFLDCPKHLLHTDELYLIFVHWHS